MNFTNLLFRLVFITLTFNPYFYRKNIEEEEKEDSFEGFLEDLIYYPGLFDSYRNDKDGKVYLLLKKTN